jgi:hypothetical protein
VEAAILDETDSSQTADGIFLWKYWWSQLLDWITLLLLIVSTQGDLDTPTIPR